MKEKTERIVKRIGGLVILIMAVAPISIMAFKGVNQFDKRDNYKINREEVINSIMEKYDLDKNGSLDRYELRNYLNGEFK